MSDTSETTIDLSKLPNPHEETPMSETAPEATPETAPRRSLKENLMETVDILKHSEISLPKAILIGVVALAAAAAIL